MTDQNEAAALEAKNAAITAYNDEVTKRGDRVAALMAAIAKYNSLYKQALPAAPGVPEDAAKAEIYQLMRQPGYYDASHPGHQAAVDKMKALFERAYPTALSAPLASTVAAPGVEALKRDVMERCAQIARDACLVPPDGGSPSDTEREMCDRIANAILDAASYDDLIASGGLEPAQPHTGSLTMTNAQIKHMVERFLQWRLPENFNPDCGISFKATFNENTPWPSKHEPVGTNLFGYTQAEEMVRFMLDGLPAPTPVAASGPTLGSEENK